MKQAIINISILAALVPIIWGCNNSSSVTNPDTINGSGDITTEVRNVNECSGIHIINTGVVSLTQDTVQSIKVTADSNIIGRVITREENGILIIGMEDGSYSNITLKFSISLKLIKKLLIEGAGLINCGNSISTDSLYCLINGAGNMILNGDCSNFILIVNGAGNINARNFTAKVCSAIINGSGNCNLFASDLLNATVIGSGVIIYYGHPSTVNTSVSGSGKINAGS